MNFRIAAVILAILGVSMQTAAQDRPMRQGPGPIIEQLALSDEQQKQFDAMATDFRKSAVDTRAEIAKARIDLMALLKADNPDQGKIAKQLGAISTLESGAKTQALNHWFAVNKILSAEQQKVWKKHLLRLVEDRMGQRQMRQGRDSSRRMGPSQEAPSPR